jgi:hypothetical protein
VEGLPAAIAEFTKRNLAEHWREIRLTWQAEVLFPSVCSSEPGGTRSRAPHAALPRGASVPTDVDVADGLRLFGDGLKEVTIAQFVGEFDRLGRRDILACGTRGAVK